MPCPCYAPTMPFFSRPRHNVRRETACGLPARVRLLPPTTRSSTKVVFRRIPISYAGGHCETKHRLSWTRKKIGSSTLQKDDLLHCWTSSSDISGYHADFHEGHGTIGAGQGRGMACVNARHGRGTAWARHAICESVFTGHSRALRFKVVDGQASNRMMDVRNYPSWGCGRSFSTFKCVDDVHQTFRIVIQICVA
jgi:hypothetical protein